MHLTRLGRSAVRAQLYAQVSVYLCPPTTLSSSLITTFPAGPTARPPRPRLPALGRVAHAGRPVSLLVRSSAPAAAVPPATAQVLARHEVGVVRAIECSPNLTCHPSSITIIIIIMFVARGIENII